ncbi:hypothetical protein MUN76_15415 [Leucobacter rhizosphaerae]|uniref:Uncharacterized protein n=1 Tax=Leucobacter rhizosphaerae TaxID=2932245 RepID=A0ABY4FVS7_9MICO|nr:hypothetical protein [Leucobacter rhizosphaerae]UOQ60397.1 hypothetical protein MUN76_15415 [Leucobacter rhizosphaerae]
MTKQKSDATVAAVRTIVPALIGVALARLIAGVPAVAEVLSWVDQFIKDVAEAGGVPLIGVTAVWLIQAALTALVIWAWYALARALGDRWPSAEKWMLGSEARPHYVARYAS